MRVAILLALIAVTSVSFAGTYSGGSGTTGNPYQIANPNDLLVLAADANDYDNCFILVNDINMAGYTFNKALIAKDTDSSSSSFQGTSFTGVFNGNGHSIISLAIDTGGVNNHYLGLFGQIGSGGIVRNLGIEDVNITGGLSSELVGGLCGYNNSGSIINCYTTGKVHGYIWAAGLCGANYGNITSCYSAAAVSGTQNVGGLCGSAISGTISKCYTTGNVAGSDLYTGGLCGTNGSRIEYSYTTGDVNGLDNTGGLVGYTSVGTVSTCYATGNVAGGHNYTGGLCGYVNSGNINKCYATGLIRGYYAIGGLCGFNNGNITSSYSVADVNGTRYAGGLCGWNYLTGNTSNSYSVADVNGVRYVGGLCGANSYKLTNCYSSGTVTAVETTLGGLCGTKYSGNVITSCYFLDTAGPDNGWGEPLTDAQMKQQASFVGWDFAYPMWVICEGASYPRVAWEAFSAGDFVCPKGVNFLDFAVFAEAWLSTSVSANWNSICDLTVPADLRVDIYDLKVFGSHWLEIP